VTIKLDLKPEVEASLVAQAQARGLSLELYLDQVLQSAAIERASDAVPTQGEAIERKKDVAGRDLRRVAVERVKDVVPTQAEAVNRARNSAGREETPPHKRPEGGKSLAQLFAESPFKGLDLKFERDTDTGRPVKL
jgi:hypothetical protein